MPLLSEPTDVCAIDVADLHLSRRPPAARSAEPDWYATQAGYLGQLKALADGLGRRSPFYGRCPLPVVCAGDVFDRWNSPAELINFALTYLPHVYAVPGQHDLPHHSYADIRKSAYWTLVEAGRITNLEPGKPVGVGPLRLWGFPWGSPVVPCAEPHGLPLEVAVVHAYVWSRKQQTGYPGAPEERRVGGYDLRGYHVAVFGDNHVPFEHRFAKGPKAGTLVYNCGGFMRRKSDERAHRPSVGLLRTDGSVTRHYLDVSDDRFLDAPGEVGERDDNGVGMKAFLEELTALQDAAIDFADAVRRMLERKRVSPAVEKIALAALDGGER